jgi:hypothetical protein
MTFLCLQKLCSTNSRYAKVQKNTHTTGRKSHARLLKEMVINLYHQFLFLKFVSLQIQIWNNLYSLCTAGKNNKRKIHIVELYDAAHKKNGRYNSEKVKELMVKFLFIKI